MPMQLQKRMNILMQEGRRVTTSVVKDLIADALDGSGIMSTEASKLRDIRSSYADKFTPAAARDFDRFLSNMEETWSPAEERYLPHFDAKKAKELVKENPRIGIYTGSATVNPDRAEQIVNHRFERIWRSQPRGAGTINAPEVGGHPFAAVMLDPAYLEATATGKTIDVSLEAQANPMFKNPTKRKVRKLATEFLQPVVNRALEELEEAGLRGMKIKLTIDVIPPDKI